jgi:hypothetical protein
MDDEEFILAARVLSSDHGLQILRVLSDDQWKIASEISSHLDIHTSTASKYLVLLHDRGLLDRRTRKTGRRSTFEYHLKRPNVLLEVDLSNRQEISPIEYWDACLTLFHRFVDAAHDLGIPDFDKEVEKLIKKTEEETGLADIGLFNPKRNVTVAKRLARLKLENGQLDHGVSGVKDASQIIFDLMKSLCIERIGGGPTKRLFKWVIEEVERQDGRIIKELGLTGTFKRGFADA